MDFNVFGIQPLSSILIVPNLQSEGHTVLLRIFFTKWTKKYECEHTHIKVQKGVLNGPLRKRKDPFLTNLPGWKTPDRGKAHIGPLRQKTWWTALLMISWSWPKSTGQEALPKAGEEKIWWPHSLPLYFRVSLKKPHPTILNEGWHRKKVIYVEKKMNKRC